MAKDSDQKNGKVVQSLARGLEILTILAEAPGNMPLKTIAEKMDLKPTTAHNLLRTLKAMSFIEQASGSQDYRLGPRMNELLEMRAHAGIYRDVEEIMTRLNSRFPKVTLTFVEPMGGDVFVRMRFSPDRPGEIQHPRNTAFNLYASASGLATLAFASREAQQLLRSRHPLLDEAAHLWNPPEKLENFLTHSRQTGFIRHPFASADHYALAVPVYEKGKYYSGSVGFSYNNHDVSSPANFSADDAAKAVKEELASFGLNMS